MKDTVQSVTDVARNPAPVGVDAMPRRAGAVFDHRAPLWVVTKCESSYEGLEGCFHVFVGWSRTGLGALAIIEKAHPHAHRFDVNADDPAGPHAVDDYVTVCVSSRGGVEATYAVQKVAEGEGLRFFPDSIWCD